MFILTLSSCLLFSPLKVLCRIFLPYYDIMSLSVLLTNLSHLSLCTFHIRYLCSVYLSCSFLCAFLFLEPERFPYFQILNPFFLLYGPRFHKHFIGYFWMHFLILSHSAPILECIVISATHIISEYFLTTGVLCIYSVLQLMRLQCFPSCNIRQTYFILCNDVMIYHILQYMNVSPLE